MNAKPGGEFVLAVSCNHYCYSQFDYRGVLPAGSTASTLTSQRNDLETIYALVLELDHSLYGNGIFVFCTGIEARSRTTDVLSDRERWLFCLGCWQNAGESALSEMKASTAPNIPRNGNDNPRIDRAE